MAARRFICFGLCLAATACGPKFSAKSGSPADTLTWAIPFELTTLDPATATEGRAFDVLRQVYEGLLAIDERGQVVPALADRWEISDDGRTYLFHLHPRVRFGDGRPFTSADVVGSYERACLPEMRSPLAPDYLKDIVGVDEVVKGAARHLAGLRAVDPLTVEIKLREPRPSFLSRLAYPVCAIVPAGSPEIRDAAQMIGTGPFIPVSRTTTGLEMKANLAYWGGTPKLSHLSIRFVPDSGTRLNLFRTGEVDLTSVPSGDVPGVRREPSLAKALVVTPRADVSYLQFNAISEPVLKDPRVRRALALCIDRKRIATDISGGVPIPAATLIPPGVPGHEEADVPPADPAAARRLLAEAGYPGGKRFPPIQIAYQDTQRENPAVEAIVTMWRKELGIEATGRGIPAPALREANLARRLPCFFTAWVGDYPDPDDFASMLLRTGSSANGSSYSNPRVDQMLDAADRMPLGPARLERYRAAETAALADAPIVPLLFLRDAELVSGRVQGLKHGAFGHSSFSTVSVRP
ncbi:ABC transporter substrate-binding protein [Fimbriimonas ginsengisoli]|uniref:Extracellular solute-binding protein n=1 Tax=Fimbriimonas ginsengisoli Gsoil 348 TaxID=661478 RepID=A0A068NYU2_FIMGI|nr:peptide ABC transporter substrate-binding protein [Fimbriimonas ginsengisoli]AIE87419.1 extracellular solute-binding protein [Fimbriimonas ginsengisoli Gsoil 348]